MIIEDVTSKDTYCFSLYFDKDWSKEYFVVRKDTGKSKILREIKKDEKNIIVLERDFGSIFMDWLNFAKSDKFLDIKSAAEKLAEIIQQGKGKKEYRPYKESLYQIYNNSDNPIEKAVALMVWYMFRVKHDEMFATKNALSKNQWKRIGLEYESYTERLFMLFYGNIKQIYKAECDVKIGLTDDGMNIYTWYNELTPLYLIYIPLLEQQKKHILTCKECGKYFIASRINIQICSDECKRRRQRKYNQKHANKINSDPSIIAYKELRQRFLDFEKTLKENKMPKEIRKSCVDARKAYEQEFDDVFKRYKANWTTLRAVNNCINRASDRLDKMIAAVSVDS